MSHHKREEREFFTLCCLLTSVIVLAFKEFVFKYVRSDSFLANKNFSERETESLIIIIRRPNFETVLMKLQPK